VKDYETGAYSIAESTCGEDYIIGKYIFNVKTDNYLKYASALAVQGSTGSWVYLPGETIELVAKHGARVVNAFEVPDYESYEDSDKLEMKRTFIVDIAFPVINFGPSITMMINSVIGEISYFGDIKMVDLVFPENYVKQFPGPNFGVEKIREYLKTPERPLVCSILKPCTGLSPRQTGELFFKVASGGTDLVKDDEKIANASYNSVAARVKECMSAEKRAYEETGKHTLYSVNITDIPDRLIDNAKAAIDAGGNMLMVSHLTSGMGIIQTLAGSSEFNVPIMAHPAFIGSVSRSHNLGISSHLSLGKLPRLCGADVSCHAISLVPLVKETPVKITAALQAPFHGLKRAWSQVGGAVHPGIVKEVINELGKDTVLGAGGGVHAHPMGPKAGVMAIRQAIDAVITGRGVMEAAKEYKELKAAIDLWGVN
jgi:2,3-diketo-5-methylthiopentyl-1-phosphate enolase